MKFSIPFRRIIRHVIAVLACITSSAVISLALYATFAFSAGDTAGDIGGPLNFIIIPFAGALLGFATSVLIYLPLGLLAERFSFRRWWRTVALLTFSLGAVTVTAAIYFNRAGKEPTPWLSFLLCTSLALYFVGGFFVYLCSVAIFRRLLP